VEITKNLLRVQTVQVDVSWSTQPKLHMKHTAELWYRNLTIITSLVLDTDGNAILADGHHVITIRTSATNYGMPFYFIFFKGRRILVGWYLAL